MYEINNLNEIISLKDQLKDMKMDKGESMQSYIMRISHLRDQFQRIGETTPDRELVIVTLRGLPPIWETFITTISNNNSFSSFDELVGKLTQVESRMISRGRIQGPNEGEPTAFVAQGKKNNAKKRKGNPSKSRRPPQSNWDSKDSRRRIRDVECYNCHRKGHYAQDCPEKKDSLRRKSSRPYKNNHGFKNYSIPRGIIGGIPRRDHMGYEGRHPRKKFNVRMINTWAIINK